MQKKFFYVAALVLSAFCSLLTADPDSCHHDRGKTYNKVWPTLRLIGAPHKICENGAIATFSEIALRNIRFNATYGQRFCLCDDQVIKVKVSGEYLMQKLDYNYSTGKARRWMRQMAIGAEGRYDLCNCFVNNALVSGWYSYSPSKRLHTLECPDESRVVRRIAGAKAYGFKGGANVTPWGCSNLDLNVFYDHVRYTRKFRERQVEAGWGFGLNYFQPLFTCFNLRLNAEWRKPFTFYGAQFNWQKQLCAGLLTVGLFVNHTQGKIKLPNVTNGGIQLGFDYGRGSGYSDGCCDSYCEPCGCEYSEIEQYVMTPAVYLPVVLGIAEEAGCSGPVFTAGSIPNVTVPAFENVDIDLNGLFDNGNGGTLHYSIATTPSFLNGPYINLDASGIIHITNLGGLPSTIPSLVVVTASTSCGSVSTSFVATLLPPPIP